MSFSFVFSFAFFHDALILAFCSSRFAFIASSSSGVRRGLGVIGMVVEPTIPEPPAEVPAEVLPVWAHPDEAPTGGPAEAPPVAALQDIGMSGDVDSVDA